MSAPPSTSSAQAPAATATSPYIPAASPDSEEIKFNKSVGGFRCHCLYLSHFMETKILGPSFERLLEEDAGFWLLVGAGEWEKLSPPMTRVQSLPRIQPGQSVFLSVSVLPLLSGAHHLSHIDVLELISALKKTWY